MKKPWARVILLSFAAILSGGTLALASGAMTDIEQKWLAFRQAVSAQQVRDGILTPQQAQSQLSELEARLKGAGDSIYEKLAKRFAVDGKKKRERGSEGQIIRLYAQLTDRDAQAVLDLCQKDGIDVWELARREGHSEHLKERMLTLAADQLEQKVQQGVMTRQQRDEALRRFSESLSSAAPTEAA